MNQRFCGKFWVKYFIVLGFTWLLSCTGLKAQAFFSYLIEGHEYLTYFALEDLKTSEDPLTRVFYGTPLGNLTYRAHPLFYGNVAVDFPNVDRNFSEYLMEILIGDEWDALTTEERDSFFWGMVLHDHNRTQITQFTRNYLGEHKEQAISAKESCVLSQKFMKDTVRRGVEWMAGQHSQAQDLDRGDRKKMGLQFVGAALHTLQDSFSAAHTQRDRHNFLIQDICTYPDPYFGRNGESRYSVACIHTFFPANQDFGGGSVLEDDAIWDRGRASCDIQDNGSMSLSFGCLKDEAQLATLMTRDFLALLVPFLDHALRKKEVQAEPLAIALEQFFNDYHPDGEKFAPPQGIMSCANLSDFRPHLRLEGY